MSLIDSSFEGESYADVNSIIADFPASIDDGSDIMFAAKKLQESFDDVAGRPESSLKVFLRVRPTTCALNETTVTCLSDTEIRTNAPDISNRAKYTKMEERHYVRFIYS